MTVYNAIGLTYTRTRMPDPRIGAHIDAALGDVASVVNVGAGSGSYEPAQTVLAVEPSPVMIGQRRSGAAPVVRGVAEALPLPDNAVDAAMALLTVHHWTDLAGGLAELRRVARQRVVILSWDPVPMNRFWLLSEYFPEALAFENEREIPLDRLVSLVGATRVLPVPVPRDCVDGFAAAYWCRPEAYLDPTVRAGMSVFAQPGEAVVAPGLARLTADLESGAWYERHAELADLDEFDPGYRLVIADL